MKLRDKFRDERFFVRGSLAPVALVGALVAAVKFLPPPYPEETAIDSEMATSICTSEDSTAEEPSLP